MKSLALAAVAALTLLAARADAAGFKSSGFLLPDGSVKVDDDRFRLPQGWDETLRWYKSVYPPTKYPRHTLPNDQVRAIHIDNPFRAEEWEGVNLYARPDGEVRVYILARKEQPAPKAEHKRKHKRSHEGN